MVDTEIHHLRDEVRKRSDQQILLEQIINNLTSLLEGSSEAMCVFDKDGFLLHSNSASRRILGIVSEHSSLPPPLFSRPNIFDFYTPWSKERVMKEFMNYHYSLKSHTPQPPSSNKWSGVVEMRHKSGNYEFTAMQTIEAIHPSHDTIRGHSSSDQVFFKTYFSIHLESSSSSNNSTPLPTTSCTTSLKEQERITTYTDLVKHIPMVGIGIWRYEGEARGCAIRLVCANSLVSQFVLGPSSSPLLPGSVIHEVLPNGIEVHRFLQEVIQTRRIATIEHFQPGHGLSSFAVTAIPLSSSYVAVVMEPPRSPSSSSSSSSPCDGSSMKTELDAIISSSLAMATCGGLDLVMCNAGFSAMLGLSSSALVGRNIINILEMRMRQAANKSTVNHSLDTLRNALLHLSLSPSSSSSSRQHHTPSSSHLVNTTSSSSSSGLPPPCQIEVELEKHAWLICVHPLTTAQQQQQTHNSQQPQSLILVHRLREVVQIPSQHSVFHIFPPSSTMSCGSNPSIPSSSATTSHFLREVNNKEDIKTVMIEPATTMPSSSSLLHHPRAKRPHPDHGDVGDDFIQHQRHRPFIPSSSSYPQHNGPVLPPLASSSPHDVIESQILKHSSAATACIDSRGNFVMANKAFAQILGYSSDTSILHTSFLDLVFSEDEDQARNVWRQLSKHENQTFDVALRFVLAGGMKPSPFTVASFIALPPSPSLLLNSSSSSSSSSVPNWMHGSVVVLQLHHAGRLRHFPEVFMADKEMLRSVFREVIVGTAVVDPVSLSSSSIVPHRLHMANPSFCAILGAPESDLTGRALLDMIHPENREKVAKVLKEVAAGQTMHQQISVRTLPKTGQPRWAAMSASSVLDSHANPFLLLAQLQLVDKPFQ